MKTKLPESVGTDTSERQLVRGTTTLLILSLLAEEPMHGYRLVKQLQVRCGGNMGFREGGVYPLLYSLEANGCLKAAWARGASGRRQKVYRVTAKGERLRRQRLERWQALVRGMELALGGAD